MSMKGLMSRFTSSRGAPLLSRVDSAESDSGELEDPLESVAAPAPSLADQVGGLKQDGRRAKAAGGAMKATRTRDALGGVKKMGIAGLEVGLDAALPGAGYAVSALTSVSAMRDAKNEGRGVMGAGVKEGAAIAAGFIPVVGEFLSFAEGAWDTARAIGESDKGRTARKLAKAEEVIKSCQEHLQQVDEVRAQVEATGDKALIATLNKAEKRMHAAIDEAQAWMKKKSDHMSLPLASAAAVDDVDDGWGGGPT